MTTGWPHAAWSELASAFKALDGELDLMAEWTFSGKRGAVWRVCGLDADIHGSRLWSLFSDAGILLAKAGVPAHVFPLRLLTEQDPAHRWLAALRYLHLNVRVLSTEEWRVNMGLIWDAPAASAWLCSTLSQSHPHTLLRQQTRQQGRSDAKTQLLRKAGSSRFASVPEQSRALKNARPRYSLELGE